MLSHGARLELARSAVEYICTRSTDQMQQPVPNCPGWTVYNAAVHVGKVGIAWQAMIEATPDDPDSRVRGYADADSRGEGHEPPTLLEWATGPIDALTGDVERACYFSMTGGHGTVGLWGRHAATELGIHRLDVEAALGDSHVLSDAAALDAIEYTAEFFLPAMAKAVDTTPAALAIEALHDGGVVGSSRLGSGEPAATLRGSGVDALLALWGRPHGDIRIDGDATTLDQWRALPGQAFQFGTWK